MVSTTAEKREQINVVIVGAGASGLKCASSLLEQCKDLELVLFEARDRLGGRVYTTEETRDIVDNHGCKSGEVCFARDHGAAWVHGIGNKDVEDGMNPIVDLLQEITPEDKDVVSTHLVPIVDGNPWTRPDSVLHKTGKIAMYMDGNVVSNNSTVITESIKRHYKRKRAIGTFINELYESGQGLESSQISVDEMNRRLENQNTNSETTNFDSPNSLLSEQMTSFPLYLFENWLGISTPEMPAEALLEGDNSQAQSDEIFESCGDYIGPHCKVKPGMAAALRPLITKVEDCINLCERVTRIEDMGDNVLVETERGRQVVADCCVCSIPLGCLQTSENLFKPALSTERMESCRAISTGVYKKVFLTFDRIFWKREIPALGLMRSSPRSDDGLGQRLLVFNLWAVEGIPCLEAVLCGDQGKWALEKSNDAIQDAVLHFMQDAMDLESLSDWCTDCHVTRWEEDPNTLGAYSTFRIGTLESHVELFHKPEWEGRLVFCGEHTELEHMGSFHGALMSGERAASDVKEFLCQRGLRSLEKNQ